MAPKSPLCKSHRRWADAKLRPLLEAHYEDGRRGGTGRSYSDLVDYYMEEYECMPFAKADFVEYLDANGKPMHKEGELRKMARRYFHNHSDPNKLATLEAFERASGQSEPHPERALCASEIWAAGEKDRIQRLTCAELGIAPDTPAAKRPDGWLGARKRVIKREFALLPEADQARWEEESQAQKASGKSKRVHPTTVQQRQKQFFGDLSSFIKKRMVRGGLGEHFVVVYQGFYVDPVAHRLSRFRGQQESFDVPKWHLSPGYDASYKHWIGYIEPLIKGLVSKDISELPDGAVGEDLASFREQLRKHFELLFKLTCGLQEPPDSTAFWAEVREDPADFVDPTRLPPGTRFKNPEGMPEHEFVLVYRHMYECYWHPEAVKEDKRFIYEQAAIHRFTAAERARLLQAATTALAAAPADPPADNASAAGTLAVGTPAGGSSAGGASASGSSADGVSASGTSPGGASADGASASGASADGASAVDGASNGAAGRPGTRKRKFATRENDAPAAPSMAQEGYITRFVDERRAPPPKKQKVVKVAKENAPDGTTAVKKATRRTTTKPKGTKPKKK